MASSARKVLIAHVPYEHRGGEDIHVETLSRAYRKLGIEPILFPENRTAPGSDLTTAAASLMPVATSPEIEAAWTAHRPLYIHLHNAFPTLGPRFFRWVSQARVPLLMTVHNHRFYCTNGIALRDRKICKDCLGSSVPWRPLAYNCNGNRSKSAYHAAALAQMNLGSLYSSAVRRFVAPSPYVEEELKRFGIPSERITHLLNPIVVDSDVEASAQPTADVFFAGRLSQEKGLLDLIAAARLLPDISFVVAGDGPERFAVELAARELSNFKYAGPVSHARVLDLIGDSRISVLPSVCNEILPTFVLESFYFGKHCVVPDLESTRWLSGGDSPGHLARAGDPADLARAIRKALSEAPIDEGRKNRIRANLSFEKFTAGLERLVATMEAA